jgi:hypothetical protein
MEPRQEKKVPEPRPAVPKQERPRRFRLVRLEERIAPKSGGHGTNHCATGCNNTTCWTL